MAQANYRCIFAFQAGCPASRDMCLARSGALDNIIALAIPLFILILLGFVAGKVMPNDARGLVWLNILVIYLAIPALIYRLIAAAPFQELTNWSFIVATTLATYVVFMVMFMIAILLGRAGVGTASMQAAAASYGNVGYMGVPLAVAFFGDKGAIPATLIVCFDSMLLFTIVPLMHGLQRRGGGVQGLLVGLRSVATNPLIIALVLGALSARFQVSLPSAVDETIGYLADAAAPAALFGIGVTVARQPLGHVNWEVPVITLCKLILHPLLVLMVLLLLGGFDPVWIQVAVLLAALPTAANVYVMATREDSYVDGSSNSILVTTLFSLATVTGVLIMIAEDWLPTVIDTAAL